MRKTLFIFFLLTGLLSQQAWGQYSTMYRLILTDKGDSGYSTGRPEEFLSEKAIERRQKQGLAVDETDLPIDPSYFTRLENLGARVMTHSKWVATMVVEVSDESLLTDIQSLPFVKEIHPVWYGIAGEEPDETAQDYPPASNASSTYNLFAPEDYGYAIVQNELFNGLALHSLGYLGEGVSIAVLDGGFHCTDQVQAFDQSRIKEAKNFTHEYGDVFAGGQEHGTLVLSCMLANQKGELIGTAPYADYYLFKTEMNNCEYPIEEDYWMAAVEYADSLGVDIISTSLGYTTFDDPSMNHLHKELDGYTIPASRLASMIASKGMILCNAAGNEGNKAWVRIGVPADGATILTVGAVKADGEISPFSSYGYTEDNRVKPDVMAMGTEVYVTTINGIHKVNGTSAACPLIAGMTACLWQALPGLTAPEVMDIVRQSADRHDNPDPYYGYGIPDFYQAYLLGKEQAIEPLVAEKKNYLWVDSGRNEIHIDERFQVSGNATLMVYTSMGSRVMYCPSVPAVIDVSNLAPGLYIALIRCDGFRQAVKFVLR